MNDLLQALLGRPQLPAVKPAPSLPQPSTDLYPDLDFYFGNPEGGKYAQDEAIRLHQKAGPLDMIRPKRPTDYGGIQTFDIMNASQRRAPQDLLMQKYNEGLIKETDERKSGMTWDEIQSMFRQLDLQDLNPGSGAPSDYWPPK